MLVAGPSPTIGRLPDPHYLRDGQGHFHELRDLSTNACSCTYTEETVCGYHLGIYTQLAQALCHQTSLSTTNASCLVRALLIGERLLSFLRSLKVKRGESDGAPQDSLALAHLIFRSNARASLEHLGIILTNHLEHSGWIDNTILTGKT